ncbi:MAG: ComEC/Rec2 family competence protein [Firmicutes bacterium]|nr:ComEC/Rec2 family competence protein [Bacillota bacterium]
MLSLIDVPDRIQGEARVIEINENLYSDTLTIKYKYMKFNMQAKKDTFFLGDIIYIDADVKNYRKDTIPFGFNSKTYYMSQGIHGYLDIHEVSFVKSSFSLYTFRDHLINLVSTLDSGVFMKALLFGEKEFSIEQSTLYKDLGIMYLLTVSGMHVYMLFLLLDKILFYLSVNEKTRHTVKIVTYIILLYLNLFSIGVLRLFIIYILEIPNKKYQWMFSKLDLMTFTFIIMLVTNIYLIYHLGFLITYLILNFLYLMEFRYRGYDGYLKRFIITSIIFIVVLPFNRLFSPLMILISPLIIGLVTGPLYLGSIATLFIPELDRVMIKVIHSFEYLMTFLNQKNISIHLPALTTFQLFIYFLIVILLFRSNKVIEFFSRIIFLSLLFIGIIFYRKTIESVIFLDVGQGDATIILSSGCVVVIDSFTNTESYLKNQGIYSIDYLILTHSDFDHTKEAGSIIDRMNVKNIVLSSYDQSYDSYPGKKIYVKSGDQIQCNALTLNVLGPIRSYPSSNDNSIVLQTKIGNLTYLLTGDIELDAEMDLIHHYGYHLKSDVFKVPHHGSPSSTSFEFLHYVSPSISILSLGYENKFGFPSPKVIERLLQYQSIIYRTDIQGSIIYTPSKKKEKWGLVLPF